MERFTPLEAAAAPFAQPDVDTDQIVPARFLQKLRRNGFGQYLFHDLRFHADGSENAGFILNQPAYRSARILVAEQSGGKLVEHLTHAAMTEFACGEVG